MALQHIESPPPPPARPDDAHKGTFGTVIVVGGSATMIGAPALAATGAFRAGAGLVKIMADRAILPFCLMIEPSATGIELVHGTPLSQVVEQPQDRVVLAVGPGMGVGEGQRELVLRLLGLGSPVVLDADGLNNLATLGERVQRATAPLVLTPHPGEYRRLAQASGLGFDPVDAPQRPQAAAALATRYNAVVVLKGHRTVVCDGTRCFVNTTGNPSLATAGSGDVLTGVIAGLMAQGMGAFDAASLGVHTHGLAADLWATRHGTAGLLARELASYIPQALHSLRCAR